GMKHVFITKLKLLDLGLFLECQKVDEILSEFMTGNDSVRDTTLDVLGRKKNKVTGEVKKSRMIENLTNEVISAMEKYKSYSKKCYCCQVALKKVTMFKNKLMMNIKKGEVLTGSSDADKMVLIVIMPDELRNHLRNIWKNERELILAFLPVLANCEMEYPTDALFIKVLSVPPIKMRPVCLMDDKLVQHSRNGTYKTILENSFVLTAIIKAIQNGMNTLLPPTQSMLKAMKGKSLLENMNTAYNELQDSVNALLDNTARKKKDMSFGLVQVLEKKEGLIRQHMMGKRVNFAARTVITPDPNLRIEEIGIPEAFATKLTYPVPVTPNNVLELRHLVINGPKVHPGAVLIDNDDGTITRIDPNSRKQRVVLSKLLLTPSVFSPVLRRPKIVHRHLCNGDMVVMNRQPTLHRAGIMGHVARVLKGEKTFRLHYANCKAYNADFDGDEMNAHFPQNEIARSETANLLNVQQQYLVPKDGTPLSGLIQDHIIAGVKLSLRGNFFTREEYHQMVYQGLHSKLTDIELLPPAILKPKKLWTGKQVISTVIMNSVPAGQPALNLTSKAKISDKAWIVERPRRWKAGGTGFTEHSMSEEEVIIKNGQLLCGVLDKSHFGATAYGLVHCMNELYGGKCSSNLLSAFSKVFNYFLRIHGFSFSVEDLLLRKKAEKKRHRLIQKSRQHFLGDGLIRSAVDLPETASLEEVNAKLDEIYENKAKGRAIVDSCYKEHLDEYTNSINKACIPSGLYQHFPDNNLQLMIQSGAKGSSVNAMQISCLLGQIELEGRRPPHMMSGKPCHHLLDMTLPLEPEGLWTVAS
ncbi:hypothetical protein L9F63_005709, partial [Diploptera punctata]